MADREQRSNRFVSDELHPIVYIMIVGLGLWFLLSAWAGFATDEYTGYLLAVVSGLFLVAFAISSAIWLASRSGRNARTTAHPGKFRDWLSGDFRHRPTNSRRHTQPFRFSCQSPQSPLA